MSSCRMLVATAVALVLIFAQPSRADVVDVDVELVLAVDISYSMDPDELALQRSGYIEALTSPDVLNAIRDGIHGRIALTYVEWAGSETQDVIVGWRVVDDFASAAAFVTEVGEAPMRRAFRTSISSALLFSANLFENNGFRGIRQVIDISGDGANNQGPLVTTAREQVLARGIVINGLPLVFKQSGYSSLDVGDLAQYYERCVIGGPGSFLVPVRERSQFIEAIRTKLVLEISSLDPWPAHPRPAGPGASRIIPAQVGSGVVWDCAVGERLWQRRYGN